MKNSKWFCVVSTVVAVLLCCISVSAAAGDRDTYLSKNQTIVHDSIKRSYELRIPKGIEKSSLRVPLVLVLHGGGGNGVNAEEMTGFTEKAVKEGFIVVYPEGTGRFRESC